MEWKATKSLRRVDGRYEIGIPWVEQSPNLPDNHSVAKKRLISLEKSLLQNPVRAQQYRQEIRANEEKGYLRKVSKIEDGGWYLPHFPVIREDKETTKLRIVLDSASKFDGIALNDAMLTGPKLQSDLLDVLLLFRRKSVAVTGDIEQMFPQVLLAPEDRKYHRILWRDLKTDQPIETYESTRLTFGDKASPFLAQFVLQQHATEHEGKLPHITKICRSNAYMDDILFSEDIVAKAIRSRQQLTQLLKMAGFKVRKWCRNRAEVLVDVPEADRTTE
ncbi:Uncharacterised protein r2_g3259 [Pycnogonum litorale]